MNVEHSAFTQVIVWWTSSLNGSHFSLFGFLTCLVSHTQPIRSRAYWHLVGFDVLHHDCGIANQIAITWDKYTHSATSVTQAAVYRWLSTLHQTPESNILTSQTISKYWKSLFKNWQLCNIIKYFPCDFVNAFHTHTEVYQVSPDRVWYWKQSALGLVGSGLRDYSLTASASNFNGYYPHLMLRSPPLPHSSHPSTPSPTPPIPPPPLPHSFHPHSPHPPTWVFSVLILFCTVVSINETEKNRGRSGNKTDNIPCEHTSDNITVEIVSESTLLMSGVILVVTGQAETTTDNIPLVSHSIHRNPGVEWS